MKFDCLNIIRKGEYSICELIEGKGHPINLKLIKELKHYLSNFESDESNGLILTAPGNIFSVGLDIKELTNISENEVKSFFDAFFDLVLQMVKFPYPLICAINGHSPAGGCVLALTSDYRIMASDSKFKIGLNELQVGVMATPSIFHLYSFWVGKKNAYHNFLSSKMFSPDEALNQGIVDELSDQANVLELAEAKMTSFLSYDLETWKGMKLNFRVKLIEEMTEHSENSISTFDHFVKNEGKQKLLDVLNGLSKK